MTVKTDGTQYAHYATARRIGREVFLPAFEPVPSIAADATSFEIVPFRGSSELLLLEFQQRLARVFEQSCNNPLVFHVKERQRTQVSQGALTKRVFRARALLGEPTLGPGHPMPVSTPVLLAMRLMGDGLPRMVVKALVAALNGGEIAEGMVLMYCDGVAGMLTPEEAVERIRSTGLPAVIISAER